MDLGWVRAPTIRMAYSDGKVFALQYYHRQRVQNGHNLTWPSHKLSYADITGAKRGGQEQCLSLLQLLWVRVESFGNS